MTETVEQYAIRLVSNIVADTETKRQIAITFQTQAAKWYQKAYSERDNPRRFEGLYPKAWKHAEINAACARALMGVIE